MLKIDLKLTVSKLITEHGVKEVLQAIAEDISDRENVIRNENDKKLSGAVEYMFPVLVQALPKVGKKFGYLIRSVLKSNPVNESLRIIKADSSLQSQAVKEAYLEWEKF